MVSEDSGSLRFGAAICFIFVIHKLLLFFIYVSKLFLRVAFRDAPLAKILPT